jgi:putative ABC transport system permease protein
MRLRTIAIHNLLRRKARAAFLVAGLLIGVGTVVALISLTQSLTGQTKANLQSFGANIVVSPRTKDVALSYGGISAGGLSLGSQTLDESVLKGIDAIPARKSISVVAPEVVGPVTVGVRRVLLMGVRPEDQFKLKRWWSVDPGRAPSKAREMVAGSSAAKVLRLTMGDYVSLGGRRFTVTGILQPTGSQDDQLLVTDLRSAQQVLGMPGKLTLIEVSALYAGAPVETISAQLAAALPQAKVATMQEAVKSRMQAVDQYKSFSYAIVAVVVAIQALVVFVTMMGSVSQRTHEIGVFRAIGFRRAHITRLILLEAAIASVVAGILGYFAGMGVTAVVLPLVASGAQVAWAPLLGVIAVGLAVAIGALAALYPALRAGAMDPTDALRAL